MRFKLETPRHQTIAIQSVVDIFEGMECNTFDNAHCEDIYANTCSLRLEEMAANIMLPALSLFSVKSCIFASG